MAKTHFKLKKGVSAFYDPLTKLHLVEGKPGFVDKYNPAKHKKVAAALKGGAIIEISEDEYTTGIEDFQANQEEGQVESKKTIETRDEEEDPNLLELSGCKTKEDAMTWAEDQTFEEDVLEEAKKIKKLKELKSYLKEEYQKLS